MLPLFPLALPSAPLRIRGNLDAAVARRVAPLFGLYDPDSPFASSWLVDVRRVLLKELAQGHPEGAEMAEDADRETPLAPTTVNKFGPDARAALLLTATNHMFVGRVKELWDVLKFDLEWTHSRCDVDSEAHRPQVSRALVFWAIGVGEIWSSYPLLVWAGLWARSIQLGGHFDVRFASPISTASLPTEYGYPSPKRFAKAPDALGLVDGILTLLAEETYEDQVPIVGQSEAQWVDDAAQNLVDVLMGIAEEETNQPAVVWAPPLASPHERITTAYVVPIQVVKEFTRRHGISPAELSSTWADWAVTAEQRLAGAKSRLSPQAFAMYLRIVEVATEWSSRGENNSHLDSASHARIQAAVADAARDAFVNAPADGGEGEPDRIPAVHAEAILRFSETRAAACRLRELAESKDSPNLRACALALISRLDEVLAGTTSRRLPTGPALAQLSRGTSDLVNAVKRVASPDDPFWSGVHSRIGDYWQEYRIKLSESRSATGADGVVSHYLGNVAGFFARVELAPASANKRLMLEQAVDLHRSRIIPYRKMRAKKRADWESFLVGAYLQAARSAMWLAEADAGSSPEAAQANRLLAETWLREAGDVLHAPRGFRTEEDQKKLAEFEQLEARIAKGFGRMT